MLAIGSAGASAAVRVAPSPGVAVRMWGGTPIRSLDPPTPLPPARSAASPTPGSPDRRDRRLSDESSLTRWANITDPEAIRSRPDTRSRRMGVLRWYTEDGFPEVYLLLRSHWDDQGVEWVQLRIPGRPNGRTGWVTRDALGPLHNSRSLLVIDRPRLHITLYRRGRRIWRAPVGIGKPSTPTPAGHFWVRERFKVLDPSSPYAPYALGTADYSTLTEWPGGGVVGIHGDWNQPWLIPGQPSHGCVRLHREDVAWLAHHIATGTPLRIL